MTPRRARSAAALLAAFLLVGCGLLGRDGNPEAPAQLDLNAAPLSTVEKLPGITPSMARRIVAERPYEDLDDLVERDILTERELERVADRVTVGPRR